MIRYVPQAWFGVELSHAEFTSAFDPTRTRLRVLLGNFLAFRVIVDGELIERGMRSVGLHLAREFR